MSGSARWRPLSDDERARFLDGLATGMSVSGAAAATGRERRRFYDLRAADEQFAIEWREAVDHGTDLIEDEARRRAVDGWDEPVFQRGEMVGAVRRYDSRLLERLLVARGRWQPSGGASVQVGVGVNQPAPKPPALADGRRVASISDVIQLARELNIVLPALPVAVDGEVVEAEAELEEAEDPS